jgi:hypothetical protein
VLVSLLHIAISLGVLIFAVLLAFGGIIFLERAPYERQPRKASVAAAD